MGSARTIGRSRCTRSGLVALGLLCLAQLAAAPGTVQAQAAAPPEVAEVLALTGLDAGLEQMPGLIAAQLESRREELPPDVAARLERALLAAFDPALLKADARAVLAELYDPALYGQGLTWLRSPLGRRLTQLEIAAGQDENQKALNEWVGDLPKHPPSKDRIKIIADIVRSSDAVSAAVEMMVLGAEPVVQTLNVLAPEPEQRSQGEIQVLLNTMRKNLIDPMGRQLLLRSLYTYRDVSDEDLRFYLGFLRSEAGQKVYRGLNAGMVSAMEMAADRFAESFESVIASRPALERR